MNASIFYLVPSARPYCSHPPSHPPLFSLSRDEAVPIFSCNFFLPTPFTRYRPLANGMRLPFAFIRDDGVPASDGPADCAHIPPRPLPSASVSATRASPSWRFISRDADRHSVPYSSAPDTPFLLPISRTFVQPTPRCEISLSRAAAKEENFLRVSLIFPATSLFSINFRIRVHLTKLCSCSLTKYFFFCFNKYQDDLFNWKREKRGETRAYVCVVSYEAAKGLNLSESSRRVLKIQ